MVFQIVSLILAVGILSLIIAKSHVFEGVRSFIAKRDSWLGRLINCPVCVSVWLSLAAVIVAPKVDAWSDIVNTVVMWLAIAGGANVVASFVYHNYGGMPDEARPSHDGPEDYLPNKKKGNRL